MGSKSRSGMGGEIKGRCVTFNKRRRSDALKRIIRMKGLAKWEIRRLDHFEKNDRSPSKFLGNFSSQRHFHHKLGESYYLKCTSRPLVKHVFVGPCSCEARMQGCGDKGAVRGITFNNACQKSIMIHAHDI